MLQALQIHMANLHDTDIDGVNDGVLWYRDAVDIVIQMLEDPFLVPHIIWGCVPKFLFIIKIIKFKQCCVPWGQEFVMGLGVCSC